MADKDFEVLYRDTPVHVRGNANLPGRFIYHVNRLEYVREAFDRDRALIQNDAILGEYDAAHTHGAACKDLGCQVWNWRMYGLPDADHNPLRNYCGTYLQLSRAEAMKGSEQTVRGFQAAHQMGVDIDGTQPNLTPSLPMSRNDRDVRIVVGTANEAKKSWRGLRGGR